MSKKSGSQQRRSQQRRSSSFEFLNYTLTEADKEWLEAADLLAEFPFSDVVNLVSEGYKVSFSHDAKNETYIASLTDRSETDGRPDYCLTGRGATPIDAWHAVCYRHFVVAQGDWTVFIDNSRSVPSRYA